MSAGHGHNEDIDTRGLSALTINRLLENANIKRHLLMPHRLDREHDLPYLGGYSQDGSTIYLDRHFPDQLTIEVDGHRHSFDAARHVCDHERFEKAVMDVLGWHYLHAHEAANGYERRGVLRAGLFWGPYNRALTPFIKADEHEKLIKVPADLDLAPYYAPPIDKKLLARLEQAMGGAKQAKEAVQYEPVASMPKQRCNKCEHFAKPHSCERVRGYIAPGAWCCLWEAKT